MRTVIFSLNNPSINGRIYTKKSFASVPEMVPLLSTPGDWKSLHGSARNILIENNNLTAELFITDDTLKQLFEDKQVVYVASGVGGVSKQNVVVDYTLACLFPTNQPETLQFTRKLNNS